MQEILFCSWVEYYIPLKIWNIIKSKVKFVKTICKDNGLTEYLILDNEGVVLYSFED